MRRLAIGLSLIGSLLASSAVAHAGAQMQFVWGGSAGTVVFIHGKADCSFGMGDCNSFDATTGPRGYFTNSYNNADFSNEATTKYTSSGTQYYEAFVIGYDLKNQGFWYSANDVGACLADLYQGTNNSGCNPYRYQRSYFHIVTHSAGATVMDRLMSTGWWGVNAHVIGNVVTVAPALAGSRASSALYGIDGYGSGWCTSLVRWLAGWAFQNNGAASLTRSAVIGEANKGYAGKAPMWFLKVTTTGGSCSANNASWWCGTNVNESDNDSAMGALAGCLGYSSSDDMDGLLYWSDSDPTNNIYANNCPSGDHSCHYYAQFTGAYWHWFETWSNHSHSRDDAYTTLGDWQTATGCNTRSPGTCIGEYAF